MIAMNNPALTKNPHDRRVRDERGPGSRVGAIHNASCVSFANR